MTGSYTYGHAEDLAKFVDAISRRHSRTTCGSIYFRGRHKGKRLSNARAVGGYAVIPVRPGVGRLPFSKTVYDTSAESWRQIGDHK